MVKLTPKEWADKWKRRAAAAEEDYKKGLDRGEPWQANTLAGEKNYEDGVKEAMADKRFGKGVKKISDAEFIERAKAKSGRLVTGVEAAEDKMEERAAELSTHIDRGVAALPARGPRRSAANEKRAVEMMRHMGKFEKK